MILLLCNLLGSLLISPASAQMILNTNCDSYVNLEDPGGAMYHVDVHDQDQIGDCYAHAAAQFYDAWRFSQPDNRDQRYDLQSSGFEINQRFKMQRGDEEVNGGSLSSVIPMLLEQGTCSSKAVDWPFVKGKTVDNYATGVMKIYGKLLAAYKQKELELSKRQFGPLGSIMHQIAFDRWFESAEAKRIKSELFQKELAQGLQQLQALNQKFFKSNFVFNQSPLQHLTDGEDVIGIFDKMGFVKCEQPRVTVATHFTLKNRPSVVPGIIGQPGGGVKLGYDLTRIHTELDRGRAGAMPIGISYCGNVLKQGRAFEFKGFSEAICGRHASLVVGRRRGPNNRCQLLIRNSWGHYCGKADYSSDWNCVMDQKGMPTGSVWVDEDILSSAIFETQQISHGIFTNDPDALDFLRN